MERLDFVGMRMIMPTRLSIKREISRLSRQSAAIAGRRLAFGYLLNREDGIAFWKQASDEMPQVFYSFGSDFLYRDDLSRFFFGKERLYGQEGLRSDRASTVPFSQPFIDSGMVEKDCPLVLSAVLPYAFLIDLRRIPPQKIPCSWEDLSSQLLKGEIASDCSSAGFGGCVIESYLSIYGGERTKNYLSNHVLFEGTLRSVTRFQESRAGVTVGPWTFLASAQIHPYAKIVWPREGAFVLPIWLGFKKRLDTMGHLIEDYFFSERYAALSARAGVPTCVSTKDPQSMRLLAQMGPHAPGWYAWPGWKALKEMDIQQLHKLQEGIAEP